jgi:hypothetical protein
MSISTGHATMANETPTPGSRNGLWGPAPQSNHPADVVDDGVIRKVRSVPGVRLSG